MQFLSNPNIKLFSKQFSITYILKPDAYTTVSEHVRRYKKTEILPYQVQTEQFLQLSPI